MEITLHTVTFDCAEADKLARFWSQLLAQSLDDGATRLADRSDDGYRWSTLADPEGNEFDIVAA